MTVNRYKGPAPPAAPPEPTFQVLRLWKDGPLDVTLLDDTILSVNTHWVYDTERQRGTTLACFQWEGECPYHGEKKEWAGFLAVWCHQRHKRAVLKIAPGEERALRAVLGIDLTWAHNRVKITPVNRGDGREALCEIQGPHNPPARLAPHAIEQTVCCVLRVARIPRQSPPVMGETEGGES